MISYELFYRHWTLEQFSLHIFELWYNSNRRMLWDSVCLRVNKQSFSDMNGRICKFVFFLAKYTLMARLSLIGNRIKTERIVSHPRDLKAFRQKANYVPKHSRYALVQNIKDAQTKLNCSSMSIKKLKWDKKWWLILSCMCKRTNTLLCQYISSL